LALSLSHPAIKNLLSRSLFSMWSFWAYISNKNNFLLLLYLFCVCVCVCIVNFTITIFLSLFYTLHFPPFLVLQSTVLPPNYSFCPFTSTLSPCLFSLLSFPNLTPHYPTLLHTPPAEWTTVHTPAPCNP
jgi:hypothetical protein